MKKFISLVLALVMALSLTTVAWGATLTAFPADDADGSADNVITLTDDVKLDAAATLSGVTVRIPADKTVVVDLNGKTLTTSGDVPVFEVKGNLTVKNGIITSTNTQPVFYGNNGSTANKGTSEAVLTLDGLTVTAASHIVFGNGAAPAWKSVTVTGGNYTTSGAGFIYDMAWDGVVTMTGVKATATGTKALVEVGGYGKSTATITDCTFTSAGTGVLGYAIGASYGAQVTINGGTYVGADVVAAAHETVYNGGPVPTVTINGGSFTGKLESNPAGGTDEGEIVITGGTFTDDSAEDYLANGFVLTQNAGGGYTANPDTAGSATAALYDLKKANAAGTEVKGDIGYEVVAANKDETNGYTTGTLEYVKMDGKLFVKIAAADATISDFYVTKANEKTAQFYLKQIDSVADVSYDFVAEKFTNFGYKCDQMNASYVDYVTNEVGYYVWTHPVTGEKVYFADDAVTTGDAYYNKAVLRTGASNLLVGDKIVEAYGFVVAGTDNPADPLNQHVWAPVAYDKTTPVKAQCGVCGAQAAVYKNNKAPAGSDVIDVTFNQVPYDLVITYTGGYIGTVVTPSTDKVESAETFDAGIAMYVGMSVMAAAGSAVVLKKKD